MNLIWEGEKKRHHCPLPLEYRGKLGSGKGTGLQVGRRQIWEQVQGSHQEEIRAPCGVSSCSGARKGAAGLAFSPTSQPKPDPGWALSRQGWGSASEQWAQVAERAGAEGRQEVAAAPA